MLCRYCGSSETDRELQLGKEILEYELAKSGAHKGPWADKDLQKDTRFSVQTSTVLVFPAPTSYGDNDN